MYKKILVPLDGSEQAEQALPIAVELARRSGAKLLLLHVLDFTAALPRRRNEEWWRGTARTDADTYLQDLAVQIVSKEKVVVSTAVVEGIPCEQIIVDHGPPPGDLIVMTSHGRGIIDRAWLGSVADAVIRHSTVPVLLVPAVEPARLGRATIRHVMVTLDGSPLAERILKPAIRLALTSEAQLTLLQVVHPWLVSTRPMAYAHHVADLRNITVVRRVADSEEYLSEVAMSVDPRMRNVQCESLIAESSDAAEILKFAVEHKVDVIALATHGRSGVKRLALGSVADKLIRGARMPVLVMRPEV